MFFYAGSVFYLVYAAVYLLASILPACILLRYIYRKDTIEKEPAGLLLALILRGIAAALCASVLEVVGQKVLDLAVGQDHPYYTVFMAFFVVAAVEEGMKYYFLKKTTWHDRNFDYLFDGVVYAVFISLGFAAFENISYVFTYGLGVALPRAVLAIPGHMGFAVFMGIHYGRARLCENQGRAFARRLNLILGYVSAVFLHGFYDSCAMIGSGLSMTVFVLFVIVMYIAVYKMIKRQSRADRPI